jgi:asparagine synthase (glutamine-hydrolysing)
LWLRHFLAYTRALPPTGTPHGSIQAADHKPPEPGRGDLIVCGLAGILRHDGGPVQPAVLEAMTAVLAHRGPDGQATRTVGGAGLGHRRLAIVDRSPAGEQPMCDDRGTLWIVCNGEIYNHLELRRELERRGFAFRSRCDTEVILYLYRLYGDDCVQHLRGMFAFALWDSERRRLLLARDRFGEKPLFYMDDGEQFCFASELKSLQRHPAFPWDVDPAAIHRFLAMDYIPAPDSVFAAVRKLPAAHRLVVEAGQARLQRYWRLDYGAQPSGAPLAELQDEVLRRFDESVRLRLMGEVPVGVFLSGGIDSNTIASAVSRVSGQPVRTFTIGFDDPRHDESRYAREAARALGTEHHERVLAPNLEALLPRVVAHFDEPFGDPSAIPTWCLAEMAGRHITVALSGEGGDEAFAGYQRYRKHQIARRAWLLPGPLRRALGQMLRKVLPTALPGAQPLRGAADLLTAREATLDEVYGRWLLHCDGATAGRLYAPGLRDAVELEDPVRLLAGLLGSSGARDPVNAMLDVDQQTYLADDLLLKLDVAAMAHAVEGRSPFLDHEFAAFVAAIPGRYKLRHGTGKWLLRRALRGRLPPAVLSRGKRGFGLPLDQWLAGPLRPLLHDTLASRAARERGLFEPRAVQAMLDEGPSHKPQQAHLLWNLLVLELWFGAAKTWRTGPQHTA